MSYGVNLEWNRKFCRLPVVREVVLGLRRPRPDGGASQTRQEATGEKK